MSIISRCAWAQSSQNNRIYHDNEWGIPIHDDNKHFEALMLEALQCGLSWQIILDKRDIIRKCFDDFDYEKVSSYTEEDLKRIIDFPGMIKSSKKISAIIRNAECFKKICKEFKSFDNYIWNYSNGLTIIPNNSENIITYNDLSKKISLDLRKRGFKYLGSITIYSYLQACGIINDHDIKCPRYEFIKKHYPTTPESI